MKVVHVLNTGKFSGAENVACQIIKITEGYVESVYCSYDGDIRKALDEREIKFSPIERMSIIELKRVFSEERPDVIHAHDMKAGLMASIAAANIPVVSHIHNNNLDSRIISVKSVLYLMAGIRAKHIFWVSSSAFEGYCFHNTLKKKSSILFNVVNIEELKSKVEEDSNEYHYDVIYLGRLTPPKKPMRLLRVLRKAKMINDRIKVAIVGTGDLYDETLKKAEEYRLRDVDFLGFNENPYKILKKSKVMIMTSQWEGTPMVALEAMALGVPIVSTPTDGMKDIVESGVTGWLSDNDDELAMNICKIISDEDLRKRMSEESELRAKNMMNIDNYKEGLLNVYRECTEK